MSDQIPVARLRALIAKHRGWKSECWNPVNPHVRTCQNGPKPCEMCGAVMQAHEDFAADLESALAEAITAAPQRPAEECSHQYWDMGRCIKCFKTANQIDAERADTRSQETA